MMNKIYKELGTDPEYLSELIGGYKDSILGEVSRDYSRLISDKIVDAVARDIYETADPEDWNMDDVRLAVGRVLCKRLRIEI